MRRTTPRAPAIMLALLGLFSCNDATQPTESPDVPGDAQANTASAASSLLTISNLTTTSDESYIVVEKGLLSGERQYVDRSGTFGAVPTSLQRSTYIRTAQDDRQRSPGSSSFLTFEVNQDVVVYVAHDDELRRPSWLTSSYTDSGLDLVRSDERFSLFRRAYPKGKVTLGSNVERSSSRRGNMYTVVIQPSASPPESPSSSPPPPPPPPSGGKTFFLADAESGTVAPPWAGGWGAIASSGALMPTSSTGRARNGSRSFKFEVPAGGADRQHHSQTLTGGPQVSMGHSGGRYLSGYYSFWAYIDAGYTDTDWNMLLGWMTGVSGAPQPIAHIGLEIHGGQLQLVTVLKNASVGVYQAPSIPGTFSWGGGWYRALNVIPFPRQRWVHVSVYYKMAQTNGQITLWQDGVKVMDLTHPTLDTFRGTTGSNSSGGMLLQFGIYGGAKQDGDQRLYADDFRVTDYRPVP